MRTASMVLGIVGGSLLIIVAIVILIVGSTFNAIESEFDYDWDSDWDSEFEMEIDGETFSFEGEFDDVDEYAVKTGFGIARGVLTVFAVLFLIGGGLGITGGALVNKNNTTGGVLMLVAALVGFGAFVILLVGGILALVPDKRQQPQPGQSAV